MGTEERRTRQNAPGHRGEAGTTSDCRSKEGGTGILATMAAGLGTADNPLRVAVVGSGPSGFYSTEALFKQSALKVTVDLFERLPAPFGLVRYGVAPDHPKLKQAIQVYEKIAESEGFTFIGNVM